MTGQLTGLMSEGASDYATVPLKIDGAARQRYGDRSVIARYE